MTYYLLKGINGIAMQTDYQEIVKCQKYIHEGEITEYTDFKEAEKDGLVYLRSITPQRIPIPKRMIPKELLTVKAVTWLHYYGRLPWDY